MGKIELPKDLKKEMRESMFIPAKDKVGQFNFEGVRRPGARLMILPNASDIFERYCKDMDESEQELFAKAYADYIIELRKEFDGLRKESERNN